ncbi:uncharacterized protein LOC132732313 [Ruditapes philippinarum]|uniref:uncharacterized protein LOC132732313 n=1 Tax=Ruditapes philippinarum TaxID=129788 RepID=UPI00295C39A9|nr:uncharacterized protein LOC132732313 [Ruditapes philippinarum]
MTEKINYNGKIIQSTPKTSSLGSHSWWMNYGNETKRKFISSPEISEKSCAKCEDEIVEKSKVECQSWKLYFCARCSGLSTTVIDLMLNGELQDYRYNCKSCKQTIPTLENIDKKLSKISDQQERRMSSLEEKVNRIEISTKNIIKEEIKDIKNNIMTDFEEKICRMIQARTNEMDDRRRRELNIVVFNLPEGGDKTGKENKKYDEDNLCEIAKDIGLDNIEIETSYRLGKKKDTEKNCRVLKVILKDRKQRKHLPEHSKEISKKSSKKFSNVVLFKDLTL